MHCTRLLAVLLAVSLIASACSTPPASQELVLVRILGPDYESAADCLAEIEIVHEFYYRKAMWLELTPANLNKLQATGVEFELRHKAVMMRLGEYSFDPLVEEPSLPAELRANYRPGKPAFYLVQLYSPPKEAWLAEMEAKGAENLGYYTAEAYRMRMTPRQAARIERLEFVRSVVPYHPAFRISPYLFECSGLIENVGVTIYDDGRVGGTVDRTVRAIEALGGTLVGRDRAIGTRPEAHATFALPNAAVVSVAQLADVLWLEYQLTELILE